MSATSAILKFGYKNYKADSSEGTKKVTAECIVEGCKRTIKGTGSTTTNFLNHTKTHKNL